ncbi:MAG: arginase family protein [Chloroflexales bacterium]|nr:arginase family protein [Chloroflexales bacterium]
MKPHRHRPLWLWASNGSVRGESGCNGVRVALVGIDLVEFNPMRDATDTTAALATKLLKELVAQMLGTANVHR